MFVRVGQIGARVRSCAFETEQLLNGGNVPIAKDHPDFRTYVTGWNVSRHTGNRCDSNRQCRERVNPPKSVGRTVRARFVAQTCSLLSRSQAANSTSSISLAASRVTTCTTSTSAAVNRNPFAARKTYADMKPVRLLPSTKG